MPDWTKEEDKWLRENFPNNSNKSCAKYLKRSEVTIAPRAHKLRIFKSKKWKSRPHPPDCLHCARRRKHLRYIEGGVSPVCECHSLPMRRRDKAWYCQKKIYEWDRRCRLKKFGINEQIFERMMREQNGMCFICQKPPSRRWNRLAIDHNHQTGKVRRLLCVTCNAILGWYEKHQKQIEEYLV
jgi:hypothetical protein